MSGTTGTTGATGATGATGGKRSVLDAVLPWALAPMGAAMFLLRLWGEHFWALVPALLLGALGVLLAVLHADRVRRLERRTAADLAGLLLLAGATIVLVARAVTALGG